MMSCIHPVEGTQTQRERLTGETGKEAILLTVHERGADNGGGGDNAADKVLTLSLLIIEDGAFRG